MKKKLLMLGIAFLISGCMAFAANYYGTVSDSGCGVKHAQPSKAAAECVAKCVKGGAEYVLVMHDKVYKLTPQDKFADFAGQRVRVTGSMSEGTITAESVAAVHHHAMKKSSGGE